MSYMDSKMQILPISQRTSAVLFRSQTFDYYYHTNTHRRFTMISIKNSDAKKVCQVDPQSRTVEIVHKGCRTTITFLENGTYKVTNTKAA